MPYELVDADGNRYRLPLTVRPAQLHIGGDPRGRIVRGYGQNRWFRVEDGIREPGPINLVGVLATDRDDTGTQRLLDEMDAAARGAVKLVVVDHFGQDVKELGLVGSLPVTVEPDGIDGSFVRVTLPLVPGWSDWRPPAGDQSDSGYTPGPGPDPEPSERADVTFVGNGGSHQAFGSSPSVTTPSGIEAGDVMICSVTWRGENVLSWADGWVELFHETEVLAGGFRYGFAIAFKVAGSEGSSLAPCSFSENVGFICHVRAYRNVDPADPVEAQAFSDVFVNTSSTVWTVTIPSVATASPNAAIDVTAFSDFAGTGASVPGSLTSLANVTRSTYLRCLVGTGILTTTTPTGGIALSFTRGSAGTTDGMALALVLQGAMV